MSTVVLGSRNIFIPEEYTAVHLGAFSGHRDVVRELCQCEGFNVVRWGASETPLHVAIERNHVGVIEELAQRLPRDVFQALLRVRYECDARKVFACIVCGLFGAH